MDFFLKKNQYCTNLLGWLGTPAGAGNHYSRARGKILPCSNVHVMYIGAHTSRHTPIYNSFEALFILNELNLNLYVGLLPMPISARFDHIGIGIGESKACR
jgi:hypothetical protein